MLCRVCREMEIRERRADEHDDAGELCWHCGHLQAPEPMMKQVRDKLSQLARFGLGVTHRALLDRRRQEDH